MWLARVSELRIYPLKSARGLSLPTCTLRNSGLEHDRDWMLVDARGRFVTQRQHPRLATLPVLPRSDGIILGPVANLPPLRVARPDDGAAAQLVEIWSHKGLAHDAGDEAARWCSEFLGHPVRLVYAGDRHQRLANAQWTLGHAVPVQFADGYPILVTSPSSLGSLCADMPAAPAMAAFRPNIVLDGLPAWAEDDIARIEIGTATLELCKPCVRCVIPSIDQQTGLPGPDPTPALKQKRWNSALRGVTFGVNAFASAGAGARLSVGDEVRCWSRNP